MAITYNFKCHKCGNETYLEAENEYEKVIICEKCAECYVVEQKKIKQNSNIPKCPTCGSTDISKLGIVNKYVSIYLVGLASNKVAKTFKCKNCGYTW